MSLQSLYNIKVNIIRITKTAGALGGFTKTEVVLHLNLPCRINWKKGHEKIFTDKNTYFRDARLYCDIVDVTEKDKVQYNGTLYDIVDVGNVDEDDRLLMLDLKLIQ